MQFIGGNGLLDGFHGGSDDRVQAFLVDWALDGDMRKSLVCNTRRADGRVELGIGRHLSDWTNALCKTTNDDLSEELGEPSVVRPVDGIEPTYQSEENLDRR